MADQDDLIHVIKVAGKPFAVNLIWNDVEDSSNAAEEARNFAARPDVNGDYYCLRSDGQQYGIGVRSEGHAKAMPSLAATIADNRPGSWVGIFEVDSGYYFIAIRDDLIIADSDKFFSNLEEAKIAFEKKTNRGDWNELIAPESFDNYEAKEIDIKNFLSGRPPRLQDVNRVGNWIKWVAAIAVIGFLIVGAMLYVRHQQQIEQELADQRDKMAQTMIPGAAQEVEIPPMPWDGRYKASLWLPACVENMKKGVITFPGWFPKSISCDGTGLATSLSLERAGQLGQGGGTINWIRWGIDRAKIKANASPSGENGATVTWAMPSVATYPPDIQTAKISDVRRYLTSQFEENFTPIRFSLAEKQQFWETLKFTFETRYDISRFNTILERVPGLVIDKVNYDLTKLVYQVEGSAFERLPIPPGMKVKNPQGGATGPGPQTAPPK